MTTIRGIQIENLRIESECAIPLRHFQYVIRCAIWYYFYNLKNVKKTHGEAVFTFFKILQILQNRATHHICQSTDEKNMLIKINDVFKLNGFLQIGNQSDYSKQR